MRLSIYFEIDAGRQNELDRVGVPESKSGDLPFDIGAVAGPDYVELARKSVRNTQHRIGGQSAGQTMESCESIVVAHHLEMVIPLLDSDPMRDRDGEFALWALDFQVITDLDLNAFRERYGLLSYS